MSETRGLYQMLMLAFIFNLVMWGVFDWMGSAQVSEFNCDVGAFQTNTTDVEQSGNVPQEITHCEPEGLPFWFYAIWIIIDGVLIYAFIPFVK